MWLKRVAQLFGVVVVGRGRQKQLLVETWT
jgi:hypothetical protein